MTIYFVIAQALMLGAIFVHSACVLSRTQFKGCLNPLWLSHVCFVGFAIYTGLNLIYKPYEFDAERATIESGVLLHLISDYLKYRNKTAATKAAKFLGEQND